MRKRIWDLPRPVQVDLNKRVRLLGKPEDLARVGVQPQDQVLDREPPVVHGGEEERKHRLEPGVAGDGLLLLLLPGVRGMMGGEDVDDVDVLPEGLAVLRGTGASGRPRT
eukprot:766142-Hanusia_phi.AAC.2